MTQESENDAETAMYYYNDWDQHGGGTRPNDLYHFIFEVWNAWGAMMVKVEFGESLNVATFNCSFGISITFGYYKK